MFALTLLAALTGLLLTTTHAKNTTERFFYKSHDLSSLLLLEAGGGSIFYDTAKNNASRDIEDILRDGGANSIKLRLFVDPSDIDTRQNNLPNTLALAQRFVHGGFRFILNLHLSDTWADPGRQNIPAAWPGADDPAGLAAAVRKYVGDTLGAFCHGGAAPSVLMLGNEISKGMLWPAGRFDPSEQPLENRIKTFEGFARLWKSARLGVDDAVAGGECAEKPEVVIHFDNGMCCCIPPVLSAFLCHSDTRPGWDTDTYANIYEALFANKDIVSVDDVDVFGLTLYPFYGNGRGTLANLKRTADYLVQTYPGKKVQVLETNWPVDCDGTFLASGNSPPPLSEPSIPISVEGQLQWMGNVTDVIKSLPGGSGQGVSYWESAYLNMTTLGSNSCDDLLLFTSVYTKTAPHYRGYSRKSVNMFNL